MFLDVANPSVIDGVDADDFVFVIIAAVIILCIISVIVYKKVKKGKKVKNEKY